MKQTTLIKVFYNKETKEYDIKLIDSRCYATNNICVITPRGFTYSLENRPNYENIPNTYDSKDISFMNSVYNSDMIKEAWENVHCIKSILWYRIYSEQIELNEYDIKYETVKEIVYKGQSSKMIWSISNKNDGKSGDVCDNVEQIVIYKNIEIKKKRTEERKFIKILDPTSDTWYINYEDKQSINIVINKIKGNIIERALNAESYELKDIAKEHNQSLTQVEYEFTHMLDGAKLYNEPKRVESKNKIESKDKKGFFKHLFK